MDWSYHRPKSTPDSLYRAGVLAALFILSASSLAFEVGLTRLFSFLFVKSYVYILISLSIAGIGFGAVLTYYVPIRKRGLLLNAVLSLPPLLLLLLFLVNSYRTLLPPSLIFTFLVFFSVGIIQVLIFQESDIRVSYLYAADLIGASVGSLLSFFLLNAAGAVYALIVIILLISLSAILLFLLYHGAFKRSAVFLLLTASIGAALFSLSFQERMLPSSGWQKEMTVMLDNDARNARIAETRWTAFGRVDLVETENPLFKTVFIDGGAGTKIVKMEGGQVSKALAQNLLLGYMGGIPLLVAEDEEKDRAAVIGSGGGIDVVTLLLAGYRRIDAIEINPDFIDIVREHETYSGGIYNGHPKVSIYEDEGRSFLRAANEDYNVILMGLPIIKSSRNFSNHSLTENYLFTRDAFDEYRRSLKEGGFLIVISHYPNELLRLVSNALSSFTDDGLSVQEAMQRVVTIGTDRNPTLILKNEAFTEPEIAGFRAILENFPVRGTTNFLPGVPQRELSYTSRQTGETESRPAFNPELYALSQDEYGIDEYVRRSEEDISPVSDDSPFFYSMEKGLPKELQIVGIVVALIIALALLLFARKNRLLHEDEERGEALRRLASFGFIGFGFMLVEIGVLQKFIVFWHHQTLALTVVLAVLLVASGTGSLISARLKRPGTFTAVAGIIVGLAVLSAFFLGPLLQQFEGLPTPAKVAATIALLFPLFLPMGMPFPYLLRKTSLLSSGNEAYPWMIGFNSLTTLGGGVLAMILAMSFGYLSVTLAGAGFYLLLGAVTTLSQTHHSNCY